MAASLLAMLSQQTPNLLTRKGLILTGLQHDFLSSDGKLPIKNLDTGFLDRIKTLIDEFRGHGDIVWVRTETDGSQISHSLDEDACNVITSLTQHAHSGTENESDDDASEPDTAQPSRKRKPNSVQSANEDGQGSSRHKHPRAPHSNNVASAGVPVAIDEEHFLSRTAKREPCFVQGTAGADFAAEVKSLVQPADLQVIKGYYSAFNSTSLLLTLRSKLITELYICGAMTNLNVYATSMDAARYGIKITLVEDCLGYRQKERHDLAIKRLVNVMGARVVKSNEVIAMVRGRDTAQPTIREALGAGHNTAEDALEVASSGDEDDEDDLLSVRASPSSSKSHRPLEIRGSRPQDKDLQMVDIGSKSHPKFQRLTATKTIRGWDAGQRTPENAVKHTCESENFECESSHPTGQQGIGLDVRSKTGTSERHNNAAELARLASGITDTKPNIHSSVSNTHTTHDIKPRERAQIHNNATQSRRQKRQWEANNTTERQMEQPLLGLNKEEASNGSRIKYDLLPPDRLDGLFHKLKEEVNWQRMHHQTGEVPRLVCCQGTIHLDGSMPVYRHPSDETIALLPWTSVVDEIRRAAEIVAGHTLNHALIQLYRAGTDYISEHSDKTLDIVPGSFIVNASFGAERVMRLRTKRAASARAIAISASASLSPEAQDPPARTSYRVRLPHNSALLMSLHTNAQYLHSINADKRASSDLTPAEKAYGGQRISITFRQIGTFLDAKSEHIWGQGAIGKDRGDAQKIVRGDKKATDKLVKGFGAENAASDVNWKEWYGDGSDILHLK